MTKIAKPHGPLHRQDLNDTSFSPGGPAPAPLLDTIRPEQELVINRLLDWAEEARRHGRSKRADHLVDLAWIAFDSPTWDCATGWTQIHAERN